MTMILIALLSCQDPADEEERRKRFLEGASAAEAVALIQGNRPADIDAVAEFFRRPQKPYKERLLALRALRLLKKQDAKEYKRIYKQVQSNLSLEASRGHGIGPLNGAEEDMLLEAMEWHADMKYEHAMYALEHYVDPEINAARKIKLPDRVRETSARLLAAYAPDATARETLWDAFLEPKEKDGLRQACYETLKLYEKELKRKILAASPTPKDLWLRKLQLELRKEPPQDP